MRCVGILATIGLMLAVAGTAGAVSTLSWQTAPVLGTSTYIYDNPLGCSDVIVVTNAGLVNIPHDVLNGGTPVGMTVFSVGQTIDAGSGIYYTPEGQTFHWSVEYVGPSRTILWEGDYAGDSGEGFVMNYADPVSILTNADVGNWTYTETWTGGGATPLIFTQDFTVVPEPVTMAGLMLGVGCLVRYVRKRRTA